MKKKYRGQRYRISIYDKEKKATLTLIDAANPVISYNQRTWNGTHMAEDLTIQADQIKRIARKK